MMDIEPTSGRSITCFAGQQAAGCVFAFLFGIIGTLVDIVMKAFIVSSFPVLGSTHLFTNLGYLLGAILGIHAVSYAGRDLEDFQWDVCQSTAGVVVAGLFLTGLVLPNTGSDFESGFLSMICKAAISGSLGAITFYFHELYKTSRKDGRKGGKSGKTAKTIHSFV